jgi:hypothetical protein
VVAAAAEEAEAEGVVEEGEEGEEAALNKE